MQTKLRPLDALCVAAAVEDGLDRLRILQSLTPQVVAQRDELSNILGDTVASIIKEQKAGEKKYEELIKQRATLKTNANKTRYKKNQEEIQEQARKLQNLTRDLCKRLRESPNVSENLTKIQVERSKLITYYEAFRSELLEKKSFSFIAQKVAKKKAKYENWQQVISTDKEMLAKIEQLNNEIKTTEQQMVDKLESLDESIKTTKDQLILIQTQTDAEKAKRDDEIKAKLEANQKMKDLNQSALVKKVRAAVLQIENESNVHAKISEYFERRMNEIQDLKAQWNTKYDMQSSQLKQLKDSLTTKRDNARTDYRIWKPKTDDAQKKLELESARATERAHQFEIREQQTNFINRLKLVYEIHAKIRGPLPKIKGKRSKKPKK